MIRADVAAWIGPAPRDVVDDLVQAICGRGGLRAEVNAGTPNLHPRRPKACEAPEASASRGINTACPPTGQPPRVLGAFVVCHVTTSATRLELSRGVCNTSTCRRIRVAVDLPSVFVLASATPSRELQLDKARVCARGTTFLTPQVPVETLRSFDSSPAALADPRDCFPATAQMK